MNANKQLREVSHLKSKNCVVEQQQHVGDLMQKFHSYQNLSSVSGIPLKTVHSWCTPHKNRTHKASELSRKWKQEYVQFLMQDSISFAHPSKKYAGKCFFARHPGNHKA